MKKLVYYYKLLSLVLVCIVTTNKPLSSLEWDPRLNDIYVYLEPANVAPGQQYWRLIRAIYQDEHESGGNHNVYYTVLDEDGRPVVNQEVFLGWPSGQTSRPTNEQGQTDIPVWGNNWCPVTGPGPYSAWVGGLPSDKVCGMGMPCNLHVNYLLTWQRAVKTASTSTGTVRGTIRDASTGQGIPNAVIEVKQAGVVKFTAQSASDGTYRIDNVPVGTYDIVAYKSGYTTETKSNITISENQTVQVDFTLTSTSDTTPPPTPTLLSPANGSSTADTTPTFVWSSVSDLSGVKYSLQVAVDSDFSTRVIDVENLAGTSYTPAVALEAGRVYFWRVKAVDGKNNSSGWSLSWSVYILPSSTKVTTKLHPPTPNTFHMERSRGISLKYTLPVTSEVELKIYNIKGELVKVLVNGVRDAGKYEVFWDGTDFAREVVGSGVYFIYLKVGETVEVEKIFVVK